MIALCRIVVKILDANNNIPINPPALYIVKDAIEREDRKNG